MNWLGFGGLMYNIYWKKTPDLEFIQRQGLLAVKIGQIHALRIDFLESEKCRHLAQLYRNAVKLPPEDFKTLLNNSMDENSRKSFAKIDEQPLAAASIGQVHKATLTDGSEVVIKLVKKDFKKSFAHDVRSVRSFFKAMIFVYPKLKKVGDPLGILQDIENYTLSELDLRNEIKGQAILKKIYGENNGRFDLSAMKFIRLYDSMSNENVLVSQYAEGKTFDELLERGELQYQTLLDFFKIFGFYIFVIGTFHGDVHPGNIILKGKDFYFVDCGSIGYVGPKIRKGLFNFFDGLSSWDYKKAAYHLNQMSEKEITGKAYEDYERKFLELYSDFTGKTVSEISLTKKMMETIKLGVHSGMVFEKGIFSVIRSLMYMDGMVLRCKPDAVLLNDMRLYIDEFKKVADS